MEAALKVKTCHPRQMQRSEEQIRDLAETVRASPMWSRIFASLRAG
jgi:hypothetical protein